MNSRKFKNDPKELYREGVRILKASDESEFLCRVLVVVCLLKKNLIPEDLSKVTGISRRTISTWIKNVDEYGYEALRIKKNPGRMKKLSTEQMEELKDTLSSPPAEQGAKKWTGAVLSEYILKTFNVELEVRQCQRILKQLRSDNGAKDEQV